MAYATKYRCEFDTNKGRSVKIDIEEDAFAGSITNLIASGESPLIILVTTRAYGAITINLLHNINTRRAYMLHCTAFYAVCKVFSSDYLLFLPIV